MQHWFWLGLSVAAVGWYLAVTFYVAVLGVKDIKQMFRRLEQQSLPSNQLRGERESDRPPI